MFAAPTCSSAFSELAAAAVAESCGYAQYNSSSRDVKASATSKPLPGTMQVRDAGSWSRAAALDIATICSHSTAIRGSPPPAPLTQDEPATRATVEVASDPSTAAPVHANGCWMPLSLALFVALSLSVLRQPDFMHQPEFIRRCRKPVP